MKIVLYTAIYGGKDNVIKTTKIDGVDNILFTDSNLKDTHGWTVKQVKGELESNNLNAKQFKILPHKFLPEYDLSIWIDGNVEVKKLKEFIDTYKDNDMSVFDHTSIPDNRNCIYDEAEAVIKLKKDNGDIVKKQIKVYKENGYPKNNGLICGGILFRKNNKTVNELMDSWWEEIKNGSIRDQISFNYVAWKQKFKPYYIQKDIRNNKFFKISKKHKK